MTNHILFVWDFHGTLEKGNVRAVHELINRVLPLFGVHRSISLAKTAELYGLSWVDYCKEVYPEGDQKVWHDMKMKLFKIQDTEKTLEKYMVPMDYADEVLRTIQEGGHSNIIVSNSSPQLIRHFVQLVKLHKYIDAYIALDSHDAPRQQLDIKQEKAGQIAEYLKGKSFSKIVKVGDRESDIGAGQAVGAITYFFRNEFNKNYKLKAKPTHEINDLRGVLREI
jgi:phosphoglycolate phosphatase-like HAD superfamily hydrolase